MKGIQGDPRGSTNPANSNEDILLRGGGGGGRNNCGRIKKKETVSEWFLHLFSVVIA